MSKEESDPRTRLTTLLNQPMTVGGKPVANRLWLAPMAALTHMAYRRVLDEYGGCGLMYTEMCSARAVPSENRHASPVFAWRDEELPNLVCQIAGGDPDDMAEAARRVEDEGFFGVDVNMGCSVSGVVKKGAGAALLKEPERALAVAEAVRGAVSIPLLVKFRTGWAPEVEPAVAISKQFESAGVDALIFHPRVAPDKRTRPPRMEHIGAVAEAVNIPVVGNGDVVTPHDCLNMLETTGCAGVAVGRMAMARPWLFSEWTQGRTYGPDVYRECAVALVEALDQQFDPVRALKGFKFFSVYFAANFTFGHNLLSKFLACKSMEDARQAVRAHVRPGMQLAKRPNMNLYNT